MGSSQRQSAAGTATAPLHPKAAVRCAAKVADCSRSAPAAGPECQPSAMTQISLLHSGRSRGSGCQQPAPRSDSATGGGVHHAVHARIESLELSVDQLLWRHPAQMSAADPSVMSTGEYPVLAIMESDT